MYNRIAAAVSALSICGGALAETIILREAFSLEERFHLANSADGSVTYLGALSTRFAGVAADASGRLIGIGLDGLVRDINYDVLGATSTGVTIEDVRGVAHNSADGRFYALTTGVSGPQLFWFDPDSGATGASLALGAFADGSLGFIENFYFDAAGAPIISVTQEDGSGTLRTEQFFSVNTSDGSGSLLFTSSADPESFVDYDPFDTGASGFAWAAVDDQQSMFRTFGEFGLNPFAFDDSAFAEVIYTDGTFPGFVIDGAVVPAPGSVLALAIGALTLRRRR